MGFDLYIYWLIYLLTDWLIGFYVFIDSFVI